MDNDKSLAMSVLNDFQKKHPDAWHRGRFMGVPYVNFDKQDLVLIVNYYNDIIHEQRQSRE